MGKTCLIYGHNGLDLDVAFNLRSFYNKMGFNSYFDTKLHSANVISIVRGVDSHIDLNGVEFEQIHVYDYGGWRYDRLVKSLPFDKSFIFTTSLATKEYLIETFGFPENNIFVIFPPIDLKLFSTKLRPIKFKLIHIGNYKHNNKEFYLDKMKHIIETFDIKVWGMNWKGYIKNEYKLMGRSGFFESSKIYSQTEYALGLMNPFQRNVTFSGRFWQGPINGCMIISEPGLFTKQIPGIIETDYSPEDINRIIMQHNGNRIEIQSSACKYWEQNNDKLKQIVEFIISNMSKHKHINNISYFVTYIPNLLKVMYHKHLL